ncbi:MAG: hypothetical protein ACLFSI_02535 [Halorhodospira sp.]
MSWLTPNTRALETQSQRNRIWIEWLKGYFSGVASCVGLATVAVEVWSRLQ